MKLDSWYFDQVFGYADSMLVKEHDFFKFASGCNFWFPSHRLPIRRQGEDTDTGGMPYLPVTIGTTGYS